jgi:hypothetical protein
MVFAILVLAALGYDVTEPPATPLSPAILVRGKAINVEKSARGADWQVCTFIIEHVYTGDAALRGRTFTVEGRAWKDLQHRTAEGPFLHVPFAKGEVGIWSLQRSGERGELLGQVKDMRRERPVSTRRVLGETTFESEVIRFQFSYDAVKRWAEIVEAVSRSRGRERIELLKKHALSTEALVSAWTVDRLADENPEGLVEFLEGLATTDEASIAAQVAADEILAKTAKDKWLASPKRLRVLERWVSGAAGDTDDAWRILQRFDKALSAKEIDLATCARLETAWLIQQPMASFFGGFGGQRLFVWSYARGLSTADLAKVHEVSFAYAADQIRTAKNRATRLNAARFFSQSPILGPSNKAAVDKLIQESKDEVLTLLLQEALRDARLSK